MARDVGLPVSAPNENDFQSLAELRVGDEIYQSWQEAVERNVRAENIPLRSLPSEFRNVPFRFPGHRTFEEIVDSANRPAGTILRRQESVEGRVEIVAAPVDSEVVKITVKDLQSESSPRRQSR